MRNKLKKSSKKTKKKLITIETEEEKFLQAIAKCRNCSHIMMAHSFLVADDGACIDAYIKKDGTYVTCECRKYAPADNLKYLEWEYERRQNNKRKGKKK